MTNLTKQKLRSELKKSQEMLSIMLFTPSLKDLKKLQKEWAAKARDDFQKAKKKTAVFKPN